MRNLPLAVLDLVPLDSRGDVAEALRFTTELARRAEAFGYSRFWVAEHHGTPAVGSASPPVLIAHLAAATSTIRVGSGGVMLTNHHPLIVAEQFGMLSSLHPGRIDLGVGRGAGAHGTTADALRRIPKGESADRFPAEIADLIGILDGAPEHLHAVPRAAEMPEIWMLGSSELGAELAGSLGLPFAFAHHLRPRKTEESLDRYRAAFRASAWCEAPQVMVSVNVTCADTDERAEELARPGLLAGLCESRGELVPLPTLAEVAAHPWAEVAVDLDAARREGNAIGSPRTVDEQLGELLAQTGTDELMITSDIYELQDRSRSYQLVSELLATDHG